MSKVGGKGNLSDAQGEGPSDAGYHAFAAELYAEERGNRLMPVIAIGATSGAVVDPRLDP